MSASIPARCCRIYQGQGGEEAHDLPDTPSAPLQEPDTISAHRVELRHVMCRDLVCARPDLEIEAVIGLIVRHHLGCIPVVDEERRPVGMITKFDIVEQLDAYAQSPANGRPYPFELTPRTADEVMMPIALTLQETSSVADAALMMTCEDTHHVLVVSQTGTLVGVVSSKDIVKWLVRDAGRVADLMLS